MQNVGKTDRIIRIILGVIFLSFLFLLEGDNRYIGLLGVILIITGLARYCTIYKFLGISTIKEEEDKQ
ncbi:MAG: YgaP family membrane protein [Halothermotrichaceae bacterium]